MIAVCVYLWGLWQRLCAWAEPASQSWPRMTYSRRLLQDGSERLGTTQRSLAQILGTSKQSRGAWKLLALQLVTMGVLASLPDGPSAIRRAVVSWSHTVPRWKLLECMVESAQLPVGVCGTVTVYVSSVDGNDVDDGSTWALAKATITGGLAAATDATFNFIYVDSAHTVTAAAAITWNAATTGSFIYVASVNRNGSSGTGHSGLLAGAAESVGASSNAFTIGSGSTIASRAYFYGLTVNGGTNNNNACDINIGAATTVVQTATFRSCTFDCKSANAGADIFIGAAVTTNLDPYRGSFESCTFKLANNASSGGITVRSCTLDFTNLTIAFSGASKPTTCFTINASHADVEIRDSDLSGYDTSGGFYVAVGNFSMGEFIAVNCKLSSTPGWITGTFPTINASTTRVNVDSADTHNVFAYNHRLGTIVTNTSTYANNGAQFDGAGISWQIDTTASCSEQNPFITPWIHRWINSTGSQDLHLQLIRDNATDYTNREVWAEFEVLENASFPNGTLTSTRNAAPFDGTAADLTNSSEVWTESMANDNEMECRVTRTVAEKCLARARLHVGKASTTFYLDPSLWLGA